MSIEHKFRVAIKTLRREGVKATAQWLSKYIMFTIFSPSLIARFKYGKNTVLKEIQDNRMYLNPLDPGIHSELLVFGSHERKSTEILKSELRSGMRVVDIGGNIGYFALIEARIVGEEGKVYAIEPAPINFEFLNKNIRLNKLEDIIETFQVAISDKDGLSFLFLGDRSNIHSLCKKSDASINGFGKIDVRTMTLPTFLSLNSISDVDFIRMDLEGFEYWVIDGATKILQERSPELFIEFHPDILRREGVSIVELLEKLEGVGYEPKYVLTKRTDRVLRLSMKELLSDDYILEQPFHTFLVKM